MKETFFAIVDWIKPGFDAVLSFFGEIRTKISEFTQQEGPQLTEAFQNIWSFVGPILGWIGDKVKWVFNSIIKPIMTGVMWAVEEVIKMVWTNIKGVITGALDVIMGAVKVFSGLFTGDFSKMWEGVKQIFSGAIKVVWNAIQLYFIGRIVKGITGFVKLFGSTIKSLWTRVTSLFTNGIIKTYNWVAESFVGRIITKIISFVKNFRTHISNMWTKVKETFMTIIKYLVSFVKNRFNSMLNSIRKIFTTVKNFFTRTWNNIKTGTVNKIKDIVGSAKSKFNGFKNSVYTIFRNIKNKISERVGEIVQKVKDMPGKMKKGVKDGAHKVKEGFTFVAGKMVDGIRKGVNGVIDAVNWAWNKLGGKKNKFGKWAKPSWYAHGTDGHPTNAPAVVGDGKGSNAGSELVTRPGGQQYLSPSKLTLVPIEKGTHVTPAKTTKKMLGSMAHYAKGTKGHEDLGLGIDGPWEAFKSGAKWLKDKVLDGIDWTKEKAGNIAKKLFDMGIDALGIKMPDSDDTMAQMSKNAFKLIKKQGIKKLTGKAQDKKDEETASGGAKPDFNYPVTSPFGPRSSPGGIGSSKHMRVDFGFPHGTKVPAQTSGSVTHAGPLGGYGNVVKVKSGELEVIYAHLASWAKKVKDNVLEGDIIGKSGNTGNSTGPHLHYEVRKDGTPVDPMKQAESGGGTGVERWRPQVKKALKANNLSTSKAMQDKVLRQIKTESNGDASITQSSNVMDINMRQGNAAQGLMQTTPTTFNAFKHKGHGNIMNGYDNLLASLAYAKSRYGKSLSFLGKGHGYKQGTNYVPEDGPAMLHKGEAVIPKEFNKPVQTDAMKLLALAGKAIQGRGNNKDTTKEEENKRLQKLVEATMQQNEQMRNMNQTLMKILEKNTDVVLNNKKMNEEIDMEQGKRTKLFGRVAY